MQHVIAKIEECSSAHEVVKSVSILLAARWVAEAWKLVSSDTILKCFRKAGITDSNFQLVSRDTGILDDPFASLECGNETQDLQDMIDRVENADFCTAAEFAAADNELPVCNNLDEHDWETEFLAQIGPRQKSECTSASEMEEQEEEDEDDTGEDATLPQPKLQSYIEALQSLDDVAAFLDHKGFTSEATEITRISTVVESLHYSNLVKGHQTTLYDYF